MKKTFTAILFIFSLTFAKTNIVCAQINTQDSLALVDFYNSTKGPHWTYNTNWLTAAPVSTWIGITVEGNRVTEMNFGNNGLNGPIPASFGNLTALKKFSAYYGIKGAFPSSIGNLTSLQSLAIVFCNDFEGHLPSSIGNLNNLEYLFLYSDNISGTIPSSIGNLTKLKMLNLAGSLLKGNIPASLNKLTNLETLDVSYNRLSGTIPSLNNLSKLSILKIEGNRFTFAGMENMIRRFPFAEYWAQAHITLNENNNILSVYASGANALPDNTYKWYKGSTLVATITGDSTYQPALSGNYSVAVTNSVATALTLYSDTLYIKTTINKTDSLALVDFYNSTKGPKWQPNNWLTSAPVSTWTGITVEGNRVTEILIGNIGVNGPIPESFGNLTALKRFSANYGIKGALPASIGNLTSLQSLSIFFCNQFNGHLPSSIGNLKNLEYLYLFSDNISGTIPSSIGNLSKLKWLNVAGNLLKGSIPASLNKLTNLEILDLSSNRLSGTIPVLNNLTKLTNLQLQFNRFTFAGLENVVHNFPFAGYWPQAPVTLNESNNTLSVYAGGANALAHNTYKWYKGSTLTATITGDSTYKPAANGNYSVAVTNSVATALTLYSDTINYIISGVNKTDSLALVDLYNSTNGPNWTNHTNWLTSAPVSSWYGVNVDINRRVNDLSLNNNNLSGKLPSSLGNLSALYTLNLSTNNLNDEIPASLAKISKLENLDLSVNKLSGEIPDSIGNLLNLSTLNLSVNKLKGKIPSSLNKFTGLLDLFLYDNQLDGQIPHLSVKFNISLQNNKLSGEVPYLYCENISLQGNELSTISPDFYGNEFSTIYVALENNKFNYSTLENVERYYQSDAIYSPQARISLNKDGNKLFAKAGGTIANNTYKWYKGATLIATITGDSTYTPTISGKYSVAVTNSVATRVTLYSDTLKYTISDNLIADKINNKISPASVYPNPAKSNATVLFNAEGKYTITVADMFGKKLQTKTGISNKEQKVQLNVSNYASGIYLITITNEKNKSQTIKLIKE